VQISEITVVCLIVVVTINTLFVGGLAVFMFLIWKKTNEAVHKVEPLLQRATQTLGKVEEATVKVQGRVDQVLEKTTALVNNVTERVDTTTAIAEEAVTEPLIGAASLMAGINRGLRSYAEQQSDHAKGDGR
jgi:hypothetical protein